MGNKIMFLVIIALVFSVSNVFALGITPGRTTFNFEKDSIITGNIAVINSDDREADVAVVVQGELSRYINLSESSFKIAAGSEKQMIFTLKMPDYLSPGMHTSKIVAVQEAGSLLGGGTIVGSAIGVVSEINVFVPYPEKYVEASLNVVGPDSKGDFIFVIPVVNRGKEPIKSISAVITVQNYEGMNLATFYTNEISLESIKRGELVGLWSSKGQQFGNYSALAKIMYDEDVLTIEKLFIFGEPAVDLESIEVKDFRLGGIAKFDMLVRNNWNEPINDFYLQMIVSTDKGGIIGNFKSATYDLPPQTEVPISAFWDSAGIQKGIYDASLLMNFGAKTIERRFKLNVQDDRIEVVAVGYVISARSTEEGVEKYRTLIISLVALIIVLALINIIWFLVLRKKMRK